MWIVLVSGEFPLSSWFCRTFSMQDECDWICFSLTAENIPGIKWIIEMNLKPLTRSRCVQVKLKKRSCGCFSDMWRKPFMWAEAAWFLWIWGLHRAAQSLIRHAWWHEWRFLLQVFHPAETDGFMGPAVQFSTKHSRLSYVMLLELF